MAVYVFATILWQIKTSLWQSLFLLFLYLLVVFKFLLYFQFLQKTFFSHFSFVQRTLFLQFFIVFLKITLLFIIPMLTAVLEFFLYFCICFTHASHCSSCVFPESSFLSSTHLLGQSLLSFKVFFAF